MFCVVKRGLTDLFDVFVLILKNVESQRPHECDVVLRVAQVRRRGRVSQVHLQVVRCLWEKTGNDVTF